MSPMIDQAGTDPDFSRAAAIADAAMREARRHRIPPEPRAFEVLYGYVLGADEDLRGAVQDALKDGRSPGLAAIERIYEEHVEMSRAPARCMRIGEKLGAELAEIAALITDRESSDARFLGSLARARDGMSFLVRPATVKQAVRDLLEISRAHAERTAMFGEELKAARREVEELTRELKALRESAYLDHLTGVSNRRRLDVVLETEIAAARERGPLCFALGDLDRFKTINDRFGHAVGDSVLQQFAAIMQRNLKGKDTPARFGGEEFAIVLPATRLLGARHVVEKIRQELASKSFVVSGTREPIGAVTASFGVVQLREGESAASLVARADRLLYAAKRGGRNRVLS